MTSETFQERFTALTGAKGLDSVSQSVRKSIRINTHKISLSRFQELARARGWQLSPVPWEGNGFFIDREDQIVPLGKTREHFLGLFYIQEASSMLPAAVLSPNEDSIVLDMAAAPGSKTTQLSNIMKNEGLILSNDFSVSRTKALATNVERQGCLNVGITTINGKMLGDIAPDTFDAILLDAPCSGEGTLWKDPSLLTRWSVDMVRKAAGLQKSLLLSAFDALRFGGRMVYSTCTFAPEENEGVIDYLLHQRQGVKVLAVASNPLFSSGISQWHGTTFHPSLEKAVRLYPYKTHTGGFFVCALQKEEGNSRYKERKDFGSVEKVMRKKEKKQYTVYLRKTYGIEEFIFDKFVFTKVEDTIWMKPEKYLLLSRYVRMDRCGIRLLTITSNGSLRLPTIAAWAIGQYAKSNIVTLDEDQEAQFMKGENIHLTDNQTKGIVADSVIVKDKDGFVLGASLFQKPSTLKNQLPRYFVV